MSDLNVISVEGSVVRAYYTALDNVKGGTLYPI